MLHKRKYPVVGNGAGVWSFVHVADAADATVAAVDHGGRGIYNVVDDDPAPVAVWLPELAQTIGAPKPWHVPRWLGRLLAGEPGTVMMTELRGASNAKAKQVLGWQPRIRAGAMASRPDNASAMQLLEELRPVAFAIAYRMLGSVAEAEDVVQEALLRVHRALSGGQRIESPRAFIATVTTRLAIDELRSARMRRERYVGEWLPEPILTDPPTTRPRRRRWPTRCRWRCWSCSRASRPSSERCSCCARCSTTTTSRSPRSSASARRTFANSRSGRGATSRTGRPRFQTSREQRDELARRFFAAVNDGDLGGLEALLAHDVVLTGDGGGKVPALARSLHGRSRVARTLLNWVKLGARVPGASIRPVEVNGGPGALLLDGEERLVAVWALEIVGNEIHGVSSIVNPSKLAHLGPVADVPALLASLRGRGGPLTD